MPSLGPVTPPVPEGGHPGAVHVTCDEQVVVARVRGHLDGRAGQALEAAAAGIDGTARRLELDLRDVTSFTAEGVAALVACRELSTGLPEGLHYRTGRGPGRDALLAAYSGAVGPEE